MKHLLASVLSLSVLVAGSAVAAPQSATTAPAAAAVETGPATPASTDGAVQRRAPGMRPPLRADGQPGPRMHRGMHAPRRGPGMQAGHPGGMHRFGPRVRLGAPLAENHQGVVVGEPRKHGLAKAPRGQEWRKLGHRYVRVTSGTNVVNEIVINGL